MGDFKRNKYGSQGIVASIEYDPNRNARIALINYIDGEKRYILHPKNLNVGDTILSGSGSPLSIGNALPLEDIPLGTSIHNIELIRKECLATIGEVSNNDAFLVQSGKAGRTRWLGKRPTVRGSVMNPCDHPHGGGEGRAPIG